MIPLDSLGFTVKAKPNARKSKIISFDRDKNEAVIAVGAPADKGCANEELIRFLSKYFGKKVKILVGKTSSKKIVRVFSALSRKS